MYYCIDLFAFTSLPDIPPLPYTHKQSNPLALSLYSLPPLYPPPPFTYYPFFNLQSCISLHHHSKVLHKIFLSCIFVLLVHIKSGSSRGWLAHYTLTLGICTAGSDTDCSSIDMRYYRFGYMFRYFRGLKELIICAIG